MFHLLIFFDYLILFYDRAHQFFHESVIVQYFYQNVGVSPRGTWSCIAESSVSVSASDRQAPREGCSPIGIGGPMSLREGQKWAWLAPDPATMPSNNKHQTTSQQQQPFRNKKNLTTYFHWSKTGESSNIYFRSREVKKLILAKKHCCLQYYSEGLNQAIRQTRQVGREAKLEAKTTGLVAGHKDLWWVHC